MNFFKILGPAGLCLVTLPALAGPLTDLIMAPGTLTDLPSYAVVRYTLDRRLPGLPAGQAMPGAGTGVPLPDAVVDGEVLMTVTPGETGPQIVMTRIEGDQTKPVASFSAKGPNPVLIFFLENVVRNMAAQTGGSPFYIRNTMRATLAEAAPDLSGTGPQTVSLTPFAQDPNAARMGDWAGLAVDLTFDPADPGMITQLAAHAGDGPGAYSETMTLEE
ncbi:hypothetical protein [Loktanella sp. M215]|uniref:hypothetical protein n=1 Tax=Loktanella sp. M215 TaxID=2675431 RepID=UPI001F35B179|nr:hypothetical protein [Loktanella sp. M215]MCF7698258.1 hypothetical protein [Loktanella sp. M215]